MGRGKKLYDKREDMAKRDVQREIDRALKERNRWALDLRWTVGQKLLIPLSHLDFGCLIFLTVLTHMPQRRHPLWVPPFLWVHTSMRFQPELGE